MIKRATFAALLPVILLASGCDDAPKDKADSTETPNTTKDSQTTPGGNELDKRLAEIRSQSTSEKIQEFNQLKDNDPKLLQKSVVAEVKKQLPLLIDDATMMADVSAEGNTFTYKFVIKGLPASITKNEEWRSNMQKVIIKNYCSKDNRVKVFRSLFPDGAVYNYYQDNKLVYSWKAQPSVCQE
ncbi:protein K [Mangrovibacter sp. SLW1]